MSLTDENIYFDSLCDTPFWNNSATWNTNNPTLTPCFISTVFIYLPSTFLLLCAPYTFYDYFTSKRVPIRWNRLNVFKLAIALTLVLISFTHFVQIILNWLKDDFKICKAEIIGSAVDLVTYCLMITFVHYQRVFGCVNCGSVWFFLLMKIIFSILSIPTLINYENFKSNTFERVLIHTEFALQIVLLLICSFADRVERFGELLVPRDRFGTNTKDLSKYVSLFQCRDEKILEQICPKEFASIPSRLTFWWFNKIVLLGFQRPLTLEDLWLVRVRDHTTTLFNRFNHFWKHKSFVTNDKSNDEKTTSNTKTNVISILVKQFGKYFFFPNAFRFVTDNIQLMNPMIVKCVMSFVSDPLEPFWHGIFFTLVMALTNVINSLSSAYQQNRMAILGMRIRTCLLSAIYRKSLVLAMHSKKDYTTGEIINLMAVDCQRFVDLFPWLNFLWTAPFQVGIALWLLWGELGVSVLAGLALMLFFIPFQSYVGRWIKKIQEKQMEFKDKRMKAINEMLNGIKVLKLYAWERAFVEKIQNLRAQELKYIRFSGLAYTCFNIMTYGTPIIVTCITFGVYIALDPNNQLTAQKAFVCVSMFNMLRVPIAKIPLGITNLIMTLIAVKRINKFLNSDEIIPYVDRQVDSENSIVMSNASFNWEQQSSQNQQPPKTVSIPLSNINLTIPRGSLVAVVGSVGSGKSSLLYALLGEMNKLDGKLNISGDQRVAYVAQQAWIQNASLKENILFGTPFASTKYHRVVDACALETDLSILPAGDLTEIGEKGINLSGGQKQRVSIARACYSDADLYLFDDPLSAVDSHVGKHIFNKVLSSKNGLLKGKTRILVTNSLYMLPEVDQIVLLKNGTVDAVGSYDELMRSNSDFLELIMNYTNTNATSEDGAIIEEEEIEDEIEEIVQVKRKKLVHQPKSVEVVRERFESIISSKSNIRSKSFSDTFKLNDVQSHSQSKLVEKEHTESGQITLSVYKHFLSALSPFWSCAMVLGYCLTVSSTTGTNLWLKFWTSDPDSNDSSVCFTIYAVIGSSYLVMASLSWLSIVFGTLNASRSLHSKLLNSIVHAPMCFFDTTPLGRIVNRFSKDVDVLDMNMTNTLRVLLNTTFTILATLFIVSYQTPWFLSIVIPFIGMYLFLQRFYVSTSRQLKRLESITRSPIFTHFSETINGVCTIKAYKATERFIVESDRRIDDNQRCIYPSAVSLCWLQVLLEFMANCLIFFASLFAVLSKPGSEQENFDSTGSGTGLSLTYALNITVYLNMCVRMMSDLENNVVSVERILEYSDVKPEADWITDYDKSNVGPKWPEDGIVRFEEYGTRYREGLDLVLKKIDFSSEKREKIGIVGRTGAGKSSLTLALFRIIEPANGTIWMDGIDISRLGLHTLRSRITIIPQEPMLFCGTIRTNLDPFSNYTDDQLWNVLELSHLKKFITSLPLGLSHVVSEGGENLSVGQRQLICLARALLRHTKVLVLDEATAAVDFETDSLIQSTIRNQFTNCTVLTIAHRLNTIMDSDRVMVLDRGNVAEFDSPQNLLKDQSSIFYSLARDAQIV